METKSPSPLETVFLEALARDPDDRAVYLQKACENDPALREEVTQLLNAHDAAGDFLKGAPEPASFANLNHEPKIPGFRIERLLGRGGIGSVYEAYDEKLQRRVAIKVLSIRNAEPARRRILAEARRSASLSDPSIVTIFSVHEEGDFPAVSMELIEGFPVDRAAANLTFTQKAHILQRIAKGIAVAHDQEIIHRDLKPENVLLTPELQPKILDFGIAVSLREAGALGKDFQGTPGYASPEQVRGEPLTSATDIFSFGSLMFKVLTGRAAYEGGSVLEILEAICVSEPPFPRDLAVGVPEDLQAICLACLAQNPAARPSAEDIAADLGRFLAGEPVRLRPALYGDLLRRKISEYSGQLLHWQRQGMISSDEKDRLETVHRRILADEDHWIIDARKISRAQTIFYTSSWLVVISAVLAVWLAREQLPPPWPWLAPLFGTTWLVAAGIFSWRGREVMASASFLAGAVLSTFPMVLSAVKAVGLLAQRPETVKQLLPDYTNPQIFVASLASLLLSAAAWRALRMTGFAWTTAILGSLTYWSGLLCAGWLDQRPEIMALWLTPLIAMEVAALACERFARVRWALPFHLIALIALVGTLDLIGIYGPTFTMLGLDESKIPFLNSDRQKFLSIAVNGYLFLALALMMERARSLDLRRASRILEGLALTHLGALYMNASGQRGNPAIAVDVVLYLATAILLLVLGPWRSSWRMLVGGLSGLAAGSYLLLDLGLVGKAAFTLSIGVVGIVASALTAFRFFKTPLEKAK